MYLSYGQCSLCIVLYINVCPFSFGLCIVCPSSNEGMTTSLVFSNLSWRWTGHLNVTIRRNILTSTIQYLSINKVITMIDTTPHKEWYTSKGLNLVDNISTQMYLYRNPYMIYRGHLTSDYVCLWRYFKCFWLYIFIW